MPTETFTDGADFTVPIGVFSLTIELEGESGESDAAGEGGIGGRVVGDLEVRSGDVIHVRSSSGGPGIATEGGDSIDLRTGGTTLSDRIAVAAGGGGEGSGVSGGGNGDPGGDGGADTGESSSGGGGTQTAGGAGGPGDANGEDGVFGDGGIGGDSTYDGGGGGAGWYGGGGGAARISSAGGGGGGGGSNYDDGLDTVTANERGTSTRSFGQGGLVTVTYEQVPGGENVAITDTTATSNTLAWDAPTLPPEVDSIDQYRIYRATDSGTVRADYTEVGTTATPGFEDTGLANGIEYHYRIGADLVVN